MGKIKKCLFLIIIFIIITYSLLSLFSINSYAAVSQSISSDINGINESLYPGIKDRINLLKSKYPNWNFKILYTNLDWNEVISNEYVGHNSGPRNQVEAVNNYQGAWICSVCTYKNGIWRCASEAAIKYMMDPRNSLNASDIFQFEELTNNGYSMNVINSMISGTYLKGHAQEIANSANTSGINPYFIIARILQENRTGTSPLVNGSKGYYNPFNIQATGNSDAEVISTGIAYAKSKGWNTLEKGITGGINFLSSEYTKKGQNTLYLQKFDVETSANGLYWHQYMQNIMAAQSEGTTLRQTYQSINAVSSSHTFIIPVYKNMPATACSRPNGSASATVTSDIVKLNVNSIINLRNAPNGTVIGSLSKDEIVTRIQKATSRQGKTYWDKVRKSDGTEGYVARETDSDETPYKLYLVPVNGENSSNSSYNNSSSSSSNTSNSSQYPISTNKVKIDKTNKIITVSPDAIANDILIAYGGTVKIVRANNEYLSGATESMATGYKVEDKYTVIKKGDVNGDGTTNSLDAAVILRYTVGQYDLKNEYFKAGSITNSNSITSLDAAKILRFAVGQFEL